MMTRPMPFSAFTAIVRGIVLKMRKETLLAVLEALKETDMPEEYVLNLEMIKKNGFWGSMSCVRLQQYVQKTYLVDYHAHVEASSYNRTWHFFLEEAVGMRTFFYHEFAPPHISTSERRCYLGTYPARMGVAGPPDNLSLVKDCDTWLGNCLQSRLSHPWVLQQCVDSLYTLYMSFTHQAIKDVEERIRSLPAHAPRITAILRTLSNAHSNGRGILPQCIPQRSQLLLNELGDLLRASDPLLQQSSRHFVLVKVRASFDRFPQQQWKMLFMSCFDHMAPQPNEK